MSCPDRAQVVAIFISLRPMRLSACSVRGYIAGGSFEVVRYFPQHLKNQLIPTFSFKNHIRLVSQIS
ncbi:unnamed protein product [Caenorhabditis auriculariae]|uniref:Uncharacterized protein n=1 Tax=Caenorhabditis auriculariae TaxID=2777116 RepID=A0A8S1HMH5_9PELO|nr:unnamed protein product [Caenorhabditis auriculariae]